ncbi:MFS transporter [Kineococcus sp. SYSU DK003]|uniref:MFS transporter n=1 Tax=Kineococcus sp. SYSU DK003 TaxID=3383124 RepID=UPI003D7F07F3
MSHASPAALRARTAVYAAFVLNGFAFSSWVSRIPSVRDGLDLTPGRLSLLLLALSVGSVLAMPLAGAVVLRIGRARTVMAGATTTAVGMSVVALAVDGLHSVPLAAAGLFLQGVGVASWDVAMNVEGTVVERRLDRAIMSRFHAGYSFGTVLAAGVGVLLLAADLPTWVQLGATAVLAFVGAAVVVRSFLPDAAPVGGETRSGITLGQAWREPRTLLIGVMVLGMAFVEGTANDWLAVGLVDGYDVSHEVGVAGFAVFVTAMTVGRLLGPVVLARMPRVRVLRICAALAVAGVLVFVFSPAVPLAVVGAALWGAGAALGFPVGMTAAADEEVNAAVRVSVVSSVGYAAFLAGPPLLGFLADHVGVRDAVTAAAVLSALALVVSGAAKPHHAGVELGRGKVSS